MSNRPDKAQYYSSLFMTLVVNFQTAAWQQMGKIKNPLTDKIERDLEQAKISIDMLDMLCEKTKNNLTEDERKFIERIISELKLNYVAELNKDKKEAAEKKQPEPETATQE